MKEKYDWDGDEAEFDEALIEDDVHPDIPAELPGVEYERDMAEALEVPDSAPTTDEDDELAAAAAATIEQANLPPVDTAEITGVDLVYSTGVPSPLAVTDDEHYNSDEEQDNSDEEQDNSDDDNSGTDDAVAGENESDTVEVEDADEDEENEDDEETNDESSPDDNENPGRRYPKRNRTKQNATVIDFENRAFKIQDGVLHLNPAVFESSEPSVMKNESAYRRSRRI
jgi:hypothetical protein